MEQQAEITKRNYEEARKKADGLGEFKALLCYQRFDAGEKRHEELLMHLGDAMGRLLRRIKLLKVE